ncbi:MAG: hypothetical protein C0506_01350 [Anaerolinea sp.]|nr:hypothetical protein [Anaerolinea sp.]
MDSAEASGKTVDDALRRALAQIGATRDDVDKERVRFDVLDEGRKGGLFGRGAKDAVVRVQRVAGAPAQGPRPEDRGQRGPRSEGGRGDGGRDRDRGRGRPEGPRPEGGRGDSGRPPRGAPRGARQSQTRTGYEQPVPKLTDADFIRGPRFEEGSEAPAAAPVAERGPRQPRGQRAEAPTRAEGERRPPREERPERPERPERGERRPREEHAHVAPDINAEEVDFAAETVDDLLRMLDIPAELNIREPLTPGDGLGSALAVIDIKGEDLGLLIGRRGDTLLSLQYLVNLIVARKYPGKGGVTIDVEHYRHRNEERIISLAKRMAERVRESGQPITLEPMSASERRLVHMTFADDPDLETNSVGEGENRKVVISARR